MLLSIPSLTVDLKVALLLLVKNDGTGHICWILFLLLLNVHELELRFSSYALGHVLSSISTFIVIHLVRWWLDWLLLLIDLSLGNLLLYLLLIFVFFDNIVVDGFL